MEDKKRLCWALPAAIFFLAMMVRGVYLWESRRNPSFCYPVVDAAGYDQMVRHLLDTGEMKIDFFWQQFFYPAYLLAVYYVSGSSVIVAKVVQLLLGCVTCVLVYRLGTRMVDRRVGVIAGVIMALYGPAVLHELELVPAGWTAFWAVALLLAFLRAQEKHTLGRFLLLGFCGGLSCITRPNFLPVLLAGCVWLTWKMAGVQGVKGLASKMAMVAVGFAAIVLPVSGLNYKITCHFGFLPASGGLNLYIGNNPAYAAAQIRPGRHWQSVIVLPENAGYPNNMWQREGFFYERTSDYLRDDPGRFARGLGRKALQVVSSREMPGNIDSYLFARWSRLLQGLMWRADGFAFPFGVLAPLAMVGLVFYWRRIPAVVLLMLVLYAGAMILTHVESRYRLGLVAVLAVPAAAGVVVLLSMMRQVRLGRLMVAAGIIVVTVLLGTLPGPFVEEDINCEAELYYGIGTNAETRGHEDHAFASYEKALAIDPDYGDAHNNLALILAKRGRIDEAMVHYHQALEVGGDSSDVYINLGNLMLRQGNTTEAMKHYREALRVRPRRAKGYAALGHAWAMKGDVGEAARQFAKAVELDEKNDEARAKLATAYRRLGRFDEAVEQLEALVKIAPKDVDAHFNLAGIYARQGKNFEAIAQLQKVLAIQPQGLDSRYMLGTLLSRTGQAEQAVAQLQEVLRRDPNHVGRAASYILSWPDGGVGDNVEELNVCISWGIPLEWLEVSITGLLPQIGVYTFA